MNAKRTIQLACLIGATGLIGGFLHTPTKSSAAIGGTGSTVTAGLSSGKQSESRSAASQIDSCVACHSKNNDEAIPLFSRSTHFRRSLSCGNCHGGVRSAATKAEAHSGAFIGSPDPVQILGMCGSCHSSQLTLFKTSRHYSERTGKPRLDCAQCHGAHTVGAQASTFSLAYFCSGCHGLEYLPRLSDQVRGLLDLTDKIRTSLRALEESGGKLTDDALGLRREVRRVTGEAVHSTSLQPGMAISAIQQRGELLLRTIEKSRK